MDEAGRGHQGVTQSHPLLVQGPLECRAQGCARLGPGPGMDTALEVPVKGVRDRQGWESLETPLECSRSRGELQGRSAALDLAKLKSRSLLCT